MDYISAFAASGLNSTYALIIGTAACLWSIFYYIWVYYEGIVLYFILELVRKVDIILEGGVIAVMLPMAQQTKFTQSLMVEHGDISFYVLCALLQLIKLAFYMHISLCLFVCAVVHNVFLGAKVMHLFFLVVKWF